MQFEKNNIHMNRVKDQANIQFTLDEDINVPDNRKDIGKIICSKSDIVMGNVNYSEKKVSVSGDCSYTILYLTDEEKPGVENLMGKLPFHENLNVDQADAEDNVKCHAYVEDFTVRVINSRKISIKMVINVVVQMENVYDEEIVCGATDMDVKTLMGSMNYACIALNGNDLFRVKEEFELPRNKPDVNRILWRDVELRGRQVRLLSDGFSIKGELSVFILYDTFEEGSFEWYETVIPFAGKIDYPGMEEDMISDIVLTLTGSGVELKTTEDGEDRQICVEAEINMDIRVYEEKTMEYLADLYSVKENLGLLRTNAKYEQILIKNNAKCRIGDKVQMKSSDSRILQICGVEGTVHMDEVRAEDDGVVVDGAVSVNIMYVTSDDHNPVATIKSDIPFSQKIEANGVDSNMVYTIRPNLEQLSATVLGNDEIEVRGFVNLDAMILRQVETGFITGARVEDGDVSWLMDFPGIIGYIANSEEALWDIAKKYRTSVERIKSINNISSDMLRKGDKILIMR